LLQSTRVVYFFYQVHFIEYAIFNRSKKLVFFGTSISQAQTIASNRVPISIGSRGDFILRQAIRFVVYIEESIISRISEQPREDW